MTLIVTATPRFELGSVYATANAFANFSPGVLLECLNRHVAGDWGDLDEEDSRANESAVLNGGRLLSAYSIPVSGRLWVITEHDRSATTLLLPSDY